MGHTSVPKSARSASSYLKIEADKPGKRVRLLFISDNNEILPIYWHQIEPDPAINRLRHRWLCIGSRAGCPLCAEMNESLKPGQKIANKDRLYPFQLKFICNCYSYEDKAVKILEMGTKLQKAVEKIEDTLGPAFEHTDLIISREGEKLHTVYYAIQAPADPKFLLPKDLKLIDLKAEIAKSARTEESLREVLSGEYDRKFHNEDTGKDTDPDPVPAEETKAHAWEPPTAWVDKAISYCKTMELPFENVVAYYCDVIFKRTEENWTKQDWTRFGAGLAVASKTKSDTEMLGRAIKDYLAARTVQADKQLAGEEVPF